MKAIKETHQRIYKQDAELIKSWSKLLGEPIPKVLNKIINSDKLELNKRIIEELNKKQVSLKKGVFAI